MPTRVRELGITPGTLPPGPLNAITDVPKVLVGHTTLDDGADLHTGVTAIVPPAFSSGLPAAVAVGNGYGKLVGATQVGELGVLETPILLTGTLSVFRVADALVTWLLERDPAAISLNPVVGETNDGFLSDIRRRPITPEHVFAALNEASADLPAEGCVGAGTGTAALGFKAGIGTSSRLLSAPAPDSASPPRADSPASTTPPLSASPATAPFSASPATAPRADSPARTATPLSGPAGSPSDSSSPLAHPGSGGGTIGVLVQANFSGTLTVLGTPIAAPQAIGTPGGNSCMIVVATDVPLDARQLGRLARRAIFAMGKVGSDYAPGSGDYAIAFSTAALARPVPESSLDHLFQAVMEATEEALLNSLTMAHTVTGHRGNTRSAVPLELVAAAGR